MGLNFKIILISLIAAGCTGQAKEIDKLSAKDRVDFYGHFHDKAVFIGGERDTSSVIIRTYKNGRINEYFLKREKGNLLFLRDTLQYTDPEAVNGLSEVNTAYFNKYIEMLRKLDIIAVNSDMKSLGIDLKIYLKNGGLRLYIKDPRKITGDPWKQYFSKARKIADNWYSIPE